MNESDINLILRRAKRANSTVLDLSNKSLNSLPSDLFEYNIITKLNLSNNKLSELDPEFKNFKNLKELDLTNNQITSLPREILSLDLSNLKLQGNPICKTFPAFKELNNNVKQEIEKYFNKTDKPIEILLPKGKNEKKSTDNPMKEASEDNISFLSSKNIYVNSDFVLDKDRINDNAYINEVVNQFKNKLKSFESKSDKIQNSSNVNDLISTKRNWMELGTKNDTDVKSSISFKSFDLEKKLEDTESALQKEILNNKRLKNELEKLSSQVRNNDTASLSSNDITKCMNPLN
jgi:hypothetical protein